MRRALRLILAAAAMLVSASCGANAARPRSEVSTLTVPGTVETLTYGSGATAHPYLVYTPTDYRPGKRVALIVMLHGCNVTAQLQMEASQFNPLADTDGFVVVYPEVDHQEATQGNGNFDCWNYYDASDWTGSGGDPPAIRGIVESVLGGWSIDPRRVYLVGMSAGSYLASDLAAIYPRTFAAVMEDAGGAYEDWGCVAGGQSKISTQSSALAAYRREGRSPRVVPRLVLGGTADHAVPAACATKSLQQSLRTNNLVLDRRQTGPISLTPRSTRTVPATSTTYGYTISSYTGRHGCLIGQRYLVSGMDHYWSGGSSESSLRYLSDPMGPDGAAIAWGFLSRFALGSTDDPCSAG